MPETSMAKTLARTPARPMPPADLARFEPARDIGAWLQKHILAEDGRLHNPDHGHLIDADLEFLWAPEGFTKQMRRVIGQAEEVAFRAGAWQRGRQEQQMREWFGRVPAFLITLDARYCATCSDSDWCALLEHECYHVAHKLDEFGQPSFTKDGRPRLTLKDHDVSEFVGVVQRYGAGSPKGAIARLAEAARGSPLVSRADIAGACGTCLLRAA
jgi:hypothetical protein